MTDLRTAALRALEAWEYINKYGFVLADYEGPMEQAITALKAALEQPNPWRDAVDHELSTLHMVASDDPRESIRRLIDWHCAVQIDPLVSSAAQELIERGKREALEQEPVQEPVAWVCFKNGELQTELVGTEADVDFWCASDEPEMEGMVKGALYTHPPRLCSGPAPEPAALLTTWVSETEAVTEPLYKAPRRLTDGEIGEVWFSARIPGLTETAARALIRAAERRSGAG